MSANGFEVMSEEMSGQDTVAVLSYFGGPSNEAGERYEEFVCNGISQGKRIDLVGGGLLRSVDGPGLLCSVLEEKEKSGRR